MSFEPKTKVELAPPKDDIISLEHLAKCDGQHEGFPTYVAIKGTVFDVTGNKSYAPGASYSGRCICFLLPLHGLTATASLALSFFVHIIEEYAELLPVFAGKDASRALAQSSLKPEDARPDWEDLTDEHKKVLDDWYTFFSKRYNIVGKVEGAMNTGASNL
ncbi:hypothetical protein K461DRAFT_130909 [Myriangium duriaei CBS 260.36]|uniref:Cytochrome b5 heme-binding domain-containing protein n=1 Tax=Myriangium duriaei CBS 260.36 TaxID=1168546 RepID=A0A9P4J3R2_9PEZI|nr:hypothetical protein K461DRAFT_130909 [Myriangium duriaei CBS 260.36]